MILDFPIFGMQPAMILWSPWVVARRPSCINSSRKPAGAGMPHEKTALERQIEATDGQIDALVYELYELTEEVIRTVEESTI